MSTTLRLQLNEKGKAQLLAAAARRMGSTARKYGIDSPQHKRAKAEHAQLCKQLGF